MWYLHRLDVYGQKNHKKARVRPGLFIVCRTGLFADAECK